MRKEWAGMRPGILAFRSISYMDVEDNVQDFLGTIGGKRIYLYEVSVRIYMASVIIYMRTQALSIYILKKYV